MITYYYSRFLYDEYSKKGLERCHKTDGKICFILSAITCKLPPPVENGIVNYDSTSFGSMATYTCDDNFLQTGSSSLECGRRGLWIGALPMCERGRFLLHNESNHVRVSSFLIQSDDCLLPWVATSKHRLLCLSTRPL